MQHVAVVTGAGSGVGRAVSLALAGTGWHVVLVGRRAAPLDETRALVEGNRTTLLVHPCDIGDPAAVTVLATRVHTELGPVQVLVNAAGTNTPRRSLRDLSYADYQQVMTTNLTGAYLCAQAFLPGMRDHGTGTIVNIGSIAGLRASALAGVAYVMSKFGMAGLTEAINAEERGNGIRACTVYPGDINTPLLDRRPHPPAREARADMLQPEDVAQCVLLVINLPTRAVVESIVVTPR